MESEETALEALRSGRMTLELSGVESPGRNAEFLLSELLGIKPWEIYLNREMVLDALLLGRYRSMVEERKKGMPLAYILGNVEFMGLKLCVPDGVFIPRQETELLCELVLDGVREVANPVVLDACTGCGAIAVALLEARKDLVCYGTDVHPGAVVAAISNAERLGVTERAHFLQGNLAEPLNGLHLRGKLDCVVSNPPYVKRGDMEGLEKEIREHEPSLALCGGDDGLEFYPRLATAAAVFLKAGGLAAFEVGEDSAGPVSALLEDSGFRDVMATDDLSGKKRFVSGLKR